MNAPPLPPRPLKAPVHDPSLLESEGAEQAENPFLEGMTSPRSKSAQASEGPWNHPAEKAPAPVRHVNSSSTTGAAPIDRRAQGAPLKVDPTIIVPHFKDPDAEFRKGSWRKPIVFLVLAGAFITGLAVLVPSKSSEMITETQAGASQAVIGTSVAPEVNVSDEKAVSQARLQVKPEKAQKKSAKRRSVSRTKNQQGSFADAFKAGSSP